MLHFDVAVVGGGIVGLAHAWMAARQRLRVLLLERTPRAEGASVRNFGMIWPVGQPAGELYELALRSRTLWLELLSAGAVQLEQCGSIHLAHEEDELAVLEEFCSAGTHQVGMLTPEAVLHRTQQANPQRLRGGMYSGTELRVNPRVASAQVAAWLAESLGVTALFGTPVVAIENGQIRVADGRRWTAERIIVASGSDLRSLYPELLAESGLRLCKLQMLKSVAQPLGAAPAPHLASGLTLRHYTAFQQCPTLTALKQRIAEQAPLLDTYGIHVMASQLPTGEVILGDSHEYDEAISPFDKTEIDDLILRECRQVFHLGDWTMAERWNGVYAKHSAVPVWEARAADGTYLFVGTGGAGMTMAFGLAERAWRHWSGELG
jgi:D-hydroxyproline dehydrogenase subunit beta